MINKTQEDRLDYLLEEFKKDSLWYKDLEVGEDYQEKRRALRSLMNIRMPGAMDPEVLEVQDDFLRKEAVEKGIVTLKRFPQRSGSMEAGGLLEIRYLSGREILPDCRWGLL